MSRDVLALIAASSLAPLIVPAVSALLAGVLVTIVTALFTRRKTDAETTEIVTKAAAQVLGNYADDNKRLRAQVIALENDNRQLKRKFNAVNAELRSLKQRFDRELPDVQQHRTKD